ncbi:flagellar basal body P-ring formation chaperone FlgA [Roseibacterium beibuensis]|uniref:Flagella basal body P-ring formation protein FlgA n=1 Tax=[Roseibacterium] beibuensis TaxID=1193142 RepID=A0ABP9LFD5_9RHOB|nr:flagellar basal body P-ring formation chaperone FlgA [Roseibacterium beibuensis]MCS6626543.1 flagellar basal body P-ring formation chaperone FlgA [Roseibacterium beibuensis]
MRWVLFLMLLAQPAVGDTVVASTTIRGQQLIGPEDVVLVEGDTPGALWAVDQAIGMEARVNLYPGRPVRRGDVHPPAIIERNEVITLRFDSGGLLIVTEGRALDRAAEGEAFRALNLSSRNTVTAVASAPGLAIVGQMP